MEIKIKQFLQDIKYFKNNGVDFREVLKIVCYGNDPEEDGFQWLDKLDNQVNKDGVLVLDIHDMFIIEGIRKNLGDEIVRYLMQGEILIPKKELDPTYLYSRCKYIDFDYIDNMVLEIGGNICLMIKEELLKEKV